MNRFNLFALVIVSFLFIGCYSSHTRPNDAFVEPTPGPMCAAESPDLAVRYDILTSDSVVVEAGTRRVALMSFRLRELTGTDVEFAEYAYRVEALTSSLTAPDGGPVFSGFGLRLSDRASDFGPDIVATGGEVVEGELWDARLLRAGQEVIFTLEADIAAGVAGTFAIRLGDRCDLTPSMRFAPDGVTPVEIPLDRIGGNAPITVLVTVVPAAGSRPL